jgi:endoglucanase
MKKHWHGIFSGRPGPATLFAAGIPLALLVQSLAALPQSATSAPLARFNHRIAVDQFGYLPDMVKVAVISDPQKGFNAAEQYRPGNTLEVRAWNHHAVVFTGAPAAWSNGLIHAQSGDRVWWFDFSPVTNHGEFYIHDPANGTRSARFRIADDVYAETLKQAVRVFYYQRRGAARVPPWADARWTDGTNFLGPRQDAECRLVTDPSPGTQKDLRGGWFDAGDYNKYVNFTLIPISGLLAAYRQNPRIWPDDWSLPESGNGIPDLLDEVKWELDWLLRMQNADGSVLSKMGVTGHQGASPPSAERSPVFYGAASTTATLTAAGNFAQAVPIYQSAGLTAYAQVLSNAAVAAYGWAVAHPSVMFTNTGFASVDPEVDRTNYVRERDNLRLRAAVYLYEVTGEPAYRGCVETIYTNLPSAARGGWDPYPAAVQGALLHYTALPGVSPAVAADIRQRKQQAIEGSDFLGAWTSGRDAYRAYLPDESYHWGNNSVKCNAGLLFAGQLAYRLDPARAGLYREAAAGYLHYLHGVNPLAMVYLTNMREHGAEFSASSMYHSWFMHGTVYDDALTGIGPAPGYVPGGANKNFKPVPAYIGPRLAPPMDQPPQKAYRNWNTAWPENSWEITEPSLSYQAPYVFLLSRFVGPQ